MGLAALVALVGVGVLRAGPGADDAGQRLRDAYVASKAKAEAQLALAEERAPREARKKEDVEGLNQALASYRQSAKEASAGLHAYLEVCQAYRRLGDLEVHVGDDKLAEKSYRTALAVFTELASPTPGDAESVRELAACHNAVGRAVMFTDRSKEAPGHFQQAIDLLTKSPAGNPEAAEHRAELARSHHGLARALRVEGERVSAQKNYRQALDILSKLAADFPDVPRYRLDLAEVHTAIGSWLEGGHWSGNSPEEDSHVGKACKILNSLVAEHPDVPLYRFRLARSLAVLANMAGDFKVRIKDFNRCIDLLTKLREEFPRVPAYRDSLHVCYTNLGEIYWMMGNLDEAAGFRQKALALSREEEAEHPGKASDGSLAVSLHNSAEVLICRDQLAEARKVMQECVTHSRAAYKAAPHSTYAASELTACSYLLYAINTALKNDAEAEKCRKEAEQVFDETWRRLSADRGAAAAAEFCNDLAVGSNYLLRYLRAKPDHRLALCLDGATLTVLAKANELHPGSVTFRPAYLWALGFKRRDLAMQVPALLVGDYRPANNQERLDMAMECQLQKQYTLALSLYADAFAAEPKIVEDPHSSDRYNAARAAALLGCSKVNRRMGGDERARWRWQARDWLLADLALQSQQLKRGPAEKAEAVKRLRQWLDDADFAGVRDPARLKDLTEAERKDWEEFWAELKKHISDGPAGK
jgi:tetratricopeptide (TPR) repeat protein